jgi:hypothetical protein
VPEAAATTAEPVQAMPPEAREPEAASHVGREEAGQGWGIAALVLGISSVVLSMACGLGLPFGIGAGICYAVQRSRKPSGMALAGLITGIIGFLISALFIVAIAVQVATVRRAAGPALMQARNEARRAAGRANLRQIGLGLAMARNDRDGRLPDSLADLTPDYVPQEALIAPEDSSPPVLADGTTRCSYEYVGPLPPNVPAGVIIACTREGVYPGGRNVLTFDGAVQWVDEQDLAGPGTISRTNLSASYEALMETVGEKMTPEMEARAREFYGVD